MSGTADVPTRYCNQCGREEHGTAGCAAQSTDEQVIVPEQRFRFIGGVPYKIVDGIPPGAKPFTRWAIGR